MFLDTRTLFLGVAAVLILPLEISAQTPEIRFERLLLEHESADYRPYDVTQDSIGFLWCATSTGLYRYDGVGARIFRPLLSDTAGISSTAIWSLCAGRGGKLWVGTFDGGLDCFDSRTESFRHFRHRRGDLTSLSAGPVRAVVEDRLGALWIGMEHTGLNRLDPRTGECEHFVHAAGDHSSLPDDRVISLCCDSLGTVWVGTVGGQCRIDPQTHVLTRDSFLAGVRALTAGDVVTALYCDRAGSVWEGTLAHGLFRFDASGARRTWYGTTAPPGRRIISDSLTAIAQSPDGDLWVGTPRGVLMFDERTGACSRFVHDPLDPNSLSADFVRRIYVDKAGVVWIAADVGGAGPGMRGLNKIVPRARRFIHYRVSSHAAPRLAVTALCQEPGTGVVWIGSMEGLRRLDLTTGAAGLIEDRHARSGSAPDIVSALCSGRGGTMWVGTWAGGLKSLDLVTGVFQSFDLSAGDTNAGNSVTTIEEERASSAGREAAATTLWVGVFGEGICRFSLPSRAIVQYRNDPSNPRSLANNRVLATCVDRHGVLWVGTDGGGLNRLDRATGSFNRYVHDDADRQSISSNAIYALCQDPDSSADGSGLLWVGTSTGLDRFNAATGRSTHVTLLDTAASIGVMSIRVRGLNLWVGTVMNGLFRVSRMTGQSHNFTSEDGLYGDKVTRAACDGPAGRLLFGAGEGFTSFQPDSIGENPEPPHVVIGSFSLFDTPVQTAGPLWTKPLIRLRYDQDFFSFRFVALDFTSPLKNTFAYRLDGFEDQWNTPGTRNFAGYTKVDPGHYVFRVKGANSDGVWNESGAAIDLVIEPPFWKTWWFRVLVGVTLVALLAAAYNYRVARLLEMERMRTRIASDLHDDIGSSLSGIALVTDALGARLPLPEPDRQRLADVTRAAMKTADALRDIVWIVNPEHESMDDILLRLKDIASAMLVGHEYHVTSTDVPAAAKLGMEVRRNIILMFKETLNNIVRHAQARRVDIFFGEQKGLFVLRVSDDGRGFPAATAKRGNGLDNLERRARQVGGRVSVTSAPGSGSTVELAVPLAR